MRIPRSVLRDQALVQEHIGHGALGPLYGATRPVRCRVEPVRRFVAAAKGDVTEVTATMLIRPEDGPIRVESKVTVRGVEYIVAQCQAEPDERRPAYWELQLTRVGEQLLAETGSGAVVPGGSGAASL